MAHASDPADLALHGVRVLGFPTAARVAGRWRLDRAFVEETLLDAEARGWARQTSFGGSSGWSLTDAGRAEDERRLARELDDLGARPQVQDVHARFRPLNRRFGAACTDWQVRPDRLDPMAANDHGDWRWDERVLRTLTSVEQGFGVLCAELTAQLDRFAGYAPRYSEALRRVRAGERGWVDAPDRDSLHLLWIQFHEDLLATLGIERGTDA
ncbi:transcriptional regulator [Blastococcus sp. TF02-8]|uniref:transcriptional regulator n=1 Tax=Blastococcus sp. TF02-8 TaxID=2250574 RepID=UPI000DE9B252|nr:transcriptional regulator [Blastococcus sp. TF02-8]RBY93801.1 transcriptional regulator [Blastococcus sp. TF02-8]